MSEKVIAVDFDGTVVKHEYPLVGEDVPSAVRVLRRLSAANVRIVLWTMRSDEFLQDAVDWYAARGIELWGVNENPQQKEWTSSPKAYAQVYIDDAALGCPLVRPVSTGEYIRPFVDWRRVEQILEEGYVLPVNHFVAPVGGQEINNGGN